MQTIEPAIAHHHNIVSRRQQAGGGLDDLFHCRKHPLSAVTLYGIRQIPVQSIGLVPKNVVGRVSGGCQLLSVQPHAHRVRARFNDGKQLTCWLCGAEGGERRLYCGRVVSEIVIDGDATRFTL